MAKQFLPDPAGSKLLLSGNEAVAVQFGKAVVKLPQHIPELHQQKCWKAYQNIQLTIFIPNGL